MKKIYYSTLCLTFLLFTANAYSQVKKPDNSSSQALTTGEKIKDRHQTERKSGGGGLEVFWSEDFSNGFDGQGNNGAWTLDAQELWFYTFPLELPDGYDPDAPLTTTDQYGDFLPNYFNDREIVMSQTRDNGVMMIDADRYNSTATATDDPSGPNTTDNPITAFLISPQIDLTGIAYANLRFTQFLRLCCLNSSFVTVDFSTDDGNSWIGFDAFTDYGVVNQDVETDVAFNISEYLQAADDLTQCRIRFNFSGDPTHYFWMIDDVNITALLENDISVGKTYFNNYYDQVDDYDNGDISTEAYYHSFELHSNALSFNRIYNFGAIVSNLGSEVQTGITLIATLEGPSQAVNIFSSDQMELAPGQVDTLQINDINLIELDFLEPGLYTLSYEVVQNESDYNPENNLGGNREFTITEDCMTTEFAGVWNGDNQYNGTYSAAGQDRIWSAPYIFTEPESQKLITHVEAAFLYAEDFAETVAGELVYFNVRKGHVFDEDPANPETLTTVLFDTENNLEYDADYLEYEIQEEDIWDASEGGDYIFASFELPNPILIEPNTIYCAEYRVPVAGGNIVFPPITLGQEKYAGLTYNFTESDWFFLGNNSVNIRFQTCFTENTDQVSFEDGIQLSQNFPNPATDLTRIQIKSEKTQTMSIQINDITGKLIHSEYLGNVAGQKVIYYDYDVSSLASGVYSYSVITDASRVSRKMIVQ